MSDKARSWKMFAFDCDGDLQYASPDKKWLEMFGLGEPIVEVDVVESKDGIFLGWIDTGEDYPVMIFHNKVFEVCFPYGSEAEVKAGKGVVVNLDISKVQKDKE